MLRPVNTMISFIYVEPDSNSRIPRVDHRTKRASLSYGYKVINMVAPDPILTCPYEDTHRIRKSVFPYHLVKCRRNHPLSKKLQCPFDAFHVVDEVSYENHILNCTSSGNVKGYKYSFESHRKLGTVPLETLRHLAVPVMKDWDEEYVESYDPFKSTEMRNIIRYLFAASKSKKKQFRLAERKRLRMITAIESQRSSEKCMHDLIEAKLIYKMRQLSLQNLDLLVKSLDISRLFINDPVNIDVSKLFINDTINTSHIPKYLAGRIENELTKKFKALVVERVKK